MQSDICRSIIFITVQLCQQVMDNKANEICNESRQFC
jgi:hypothetical protein